MQHDDAEEMDWGLNKEADAQTLERIKILAEECWRERQAIKEESDRLKERAAVVGKKERNIQELLELAKLESFEVPNIVRYEIKEDAGILGPQDDEALREFKKWYAERNPDGFDSFFKPHAGSLKAFLKKEKMRFDAEDKPFEIPGIPPPKPYRYIKAKEL